MLSHFADFFSTLCIPLLFTGPAELSPASYCLLTDSHQRGGIVIKYVCQCLIVKPAGEYLLDFNSWMVEWGIYAEQDSIVTYRFVGFFDFASHWHAAHLQIEIRIASGHPDRCVDIESS